MQDNLSQKDKKTLKIFSPWKIGVAIALGLGCSSYLLYQSLTEGGNSATFIEILSNPNWFWVGLVFIVLFARDAGYSYRIKHITSGRLTWRGSINTILLWEFASAVTPTVVGGTAVAVFILKREGIKFGRAVAYVMITAILDNAFFLIAAPIVFLAYEQSPFAGFDDGATKWGMQATFYTSYSLIFIYTMFMASSTIFFPKTIRWIILFIVRKFKIKKRRDMLLNFSNEVYTASQELNGKDFSYWSKALLSTIFVWCSRYFILNCILAALSTSMSLKEHLAAFSKHVILWVTMLFSPTPGAAGVTELFLQELFGDSPQTSAVSMIWRILTFFLYLIIGSILLPRWIKNSGKRLEEKAK